MTFSLKPLRSLIYVFNWFYIIWCFVLFLSIDCNINIDKVLSINTSANLSVFGNFNIHYEDLLTCSGGRERDLLRSVIIFVVFFLFQITLLRLLAFLLRSLTVMLIYSCSFGFVHSFWPKPLFYSGISSIEELWSYCCLSFHWLSF